jgi:RNA polymerase sigma-70 factor (ECF subfamily)
MVWRSLRRLGVPASSLDDAVQDVFLVVHRRWNDFRNQSSRRTWIYGIAIRVASEHSRRARREQQRSSATDPDLVNSEALEPDALTDQSLRQREAGRLLHQLLDALAEGDRQILVLVDLEERSVVEAAEAMGVNLNTAYSRLRRARQNFEKALKAARPPRSDEA